MASLPKKEEIISMITSMNEIMPSITNVISKFNKDIKVVDAVNFSNSFPIVLNTFIAAFWELESFTSVINQKSLDNLNNFIYNLTLKDPSNKTLLDSNGNPITVFNPIGSMIGSITTMIKGVDMASFIKLPMTMKMTGKTFNAAFKMLEKVMEDNASFLAKIQTSSTVKTILEEEKRKKTEEQVKQGTGRIFLELSIVFKSLEDVQNSIINLSKKAIRTIIAVKIVDGLLEKIESPLKKIMDILNVFTKKGGVLGHERVIFDGDAAKTISNNWKTFDSTIHGIFNSFMLMGLKAIIVILAFIPIRVAFWLMTDFLIPAANKLFKKIADKNFNKNLQQTSLTLMVIGGTLLTMAVVLYVSTMIVRLNFEDIFTGLGELILCFGAVALLMWIIDKYLGPKDLIKPVLSLMVLTGALLLMAGTLYVLSVINYKYLPTAFLALTGLTLFVVGLLSILKFVKIGVNEVLGGVMDIMKTMGALALGVLLMAGVLWVIDWMFKEVPITDILADLAILALCTLSLIGILYMVKNSSVDLKTLAVMLCISASVRAIAEALSIVTESVNNGTDMIAIGIFVAATAALVGLYTFVGSIMMSGAGAAAIYAAAAAFVAIGASVLMISYSFKIIVETIGELVELLQDGDRVKEAMDQFPGLITSFVGAITAVKIADILKAVVKANLLAAAIAPASRAIGGMINVIKEMADGSFEFNDPNHPGEIVEYNVIEMFNAGLLDKIGENLTVLIKGFAESIASVDWATCKKVMNREDFMKSLGDAIGPVYQLVDMVKNMAEGTITIDDEDVNFVDWINGNSSKITKSIQSMILAFMDAMSMGMGLGNAEDWWDDVFEEYMDAAKDGLEEVPELIELIIGMSDGLLTVCGKIDELTATDSFMNFDVYLSKMCQGLVGWYDDNLFKNLDDIEKAVDQLVDITKDMVKISGNIEELDGTGEVFDKFIDGNVRFVDSINKLDTSKANALAHVFDKLASLSESLNGNFDKLADAISDKLINTLQQLNDTISESTASASGIGGQLRRMVGTGGEVGGGILDRFMDTITPGENEDNNKNEKILDLLQSINEEIRDINNMCTDGVATKPVGTKWG